MLLFCRGLRTHPLYIIVWTCRATRACCSSFQHGLLTAGERQTRSFLFPHWGRHSVKRKKNGMKSLFSFFLPHSQEKEQLCQRDGRRWAQLSSTVTGGFEDFGASFLSNEDRILAFRTTCLLHWAFDRVKRVMQLVHPCARNVFLLRRWEEGGHRVSLTLRWCKIICWFRASNHQVNCFLLIKLSKWGYCFSSRHV